MQAPNSQHGAITCVHFQRRLYLHEHFMARKLLVFSLLVPYQCDTQCGASPIIALPAACSVSEGTAWSNIRTEGRTAPPLPPPPPLKSAVTLMRVNPLAT